MIWFYSAFLATVISVLSLSRIAYKEHDRTRPVSLSELAASRQPLLSHFRKILLLCGTLFALTMYGFVGPRIESALPVVAAWTVTYLGEILLAIFPAYKNTLRLHEAFAYAMAGGMLAMAYLFFVSLEGLYASAELYIAIGMSLLAGLTIADRPRFIFYELSFIFLSHLSIVVAAIALH